MKNLEDELVRACGIRNISELTKSGTVKEFKRDIISCTNLGSRLQTCQFKIAEMWKKIPMNNFEKFGNEAEKIKIYN